MIYYRYHRSLVVRGCYVCGAPISVGQKYCRRSFKEFTTWHEHCVCCSCAAVDRMRRNYQTYVVEDKT